MGLQPIRARDIAFALTVWADIAECLAGLKL
jgi:hypothetical protein